MKIETITHWMKKFHQSQKLAKAFRHNRKIIIDEENDVITVVVNQHFNED